MVEWKIGICNWFSAKLGYGFIIEDDGHDDLFVHYSDIISDDFNGFKKLQDGETVRYRKEQDKRGKWKAKEVSVLGEWETATEDSTYYSRLLARLRHKELEDVEGEVEHGGIKWTIFAELLKAAKNNGLEGFEDGDDEDFQEKIEVRRSPARR